ncbi:MAG: hypothetical protein ACRDIB_01795, partial [Ardenticatenaceae bacterium]
ISVSVATRLIARALRGQRFPLQVSSVLVLVAFTLTGIISTDAVRLRLDKIAPLFSLYAINITYVLAATGVLFNVLYQRGHPVRVAFQRAGSVASSVVLVLTWLYFTGLIYLPSFDWTTLGNGPTPTLKSTLFAILTMGYLVIVGGLASWQQWVQYRAEFSPLVKSRLALAFVSGVATTAFFAVLLMNFLAKRLGILLPESIVGTIVVGLSLLSAGSCLLWAWYPKKVLVWPWAVRRAYLIAPLQQELNHFYPPLLLSVPRKWVRWLRPHQCVSLALIHALDSTRLLVTRSDPAARRLAELIQNAQLNDKSFDEAIQSCIEIGQQIISPCKER